MPLNITKTEQKQNKLMNDQNKTPKFKENDNMMDQYKIARNSIEHFDKLLSDFRKIVWGFNGTVVAAVIAFQGRTIMKCDSSSDLTDKTQVKILILGSILFTIINILIWALEKHYHRYLTISAKVSEEIEKKLFDNKVIQLTYQLKGVRTHDFFDGLTEVSKFIRSYDCIYLFPMCSSEILNLYLAWKFKNIEWWLVVGVVFIFSLLASYVIIRRSYLMTSCYRLKE